MTICFDLMYAFNTKYIRNIHLFIQSLLVGFTTTVYINILYNKLRLNIELCIFIYFPNTLENEINTAYQAITSAGPKVEVVTSESNPKTDNRKNLIYSTRI